MTAMEHNPRPWVVIKFGGTSVSTRVRWETIHSIARAHIAKGRRLLIVCSALGGVSNSLERVLSNGGNGPTDGALQALREQHMSLASDLELDGETLLGAPLQELESLCLGLSLTGELSPGLRARIMSYGEILSTTLGAAWLSQQGLETGWLDARELLEALPCSSRSEARGRLNAHVQHGVDLDLRRDLEARAEPALLTQGFIARNAQGKTVLLGRGGSDTSATLLAAKLEAERCEIWTDMPGMYTANPRQVPEARLLRTLDYSEAQELASTGAQILHPRCIAPVCEARIPLHVRCTEHPDRGGTVIGTDAAEEGAQVKAISTRRGITLVSMETVGMWHQSGFLATIFGLFKRHALSVDLVSTSETNITVSLDPAGDSADSAALGYLLEDLAPLCQARVIGPCASVSLVGRNIRATLHKLGPALSVFEEQQVHLLTQAASDLNLTFVVDEDQAERLVARLHDLLFPHSTGAAHLGPCWSEVQTQAERQDWWRTRRDELIELVQEGPCFVYEEASLDSAVAELSAAQGLARVLYSVKANSHPRILQRFVRAGLGLECVSPAEVDLALEAGATPEQVLFTPNFAPRGDYEYGLQKGVQVTLDSLFPLENWSAMFAGAQLFLRLDPGEGHGHHEFVRTAGSNSKFGIAHAELERVARLVEEAGATVVGLHAHVGSGILDSGGWSRTARYLASAMEHFPKVRTLDLGGGLGVVERPGMAPLDVAALDESLQRVRNEFPHLDLWMEPGRFLVARAGVLLARVTQVKEKGAVTYVGIETGMNSLIRPALYGAYHEIVNLSRLDEACTQIAHVVGPICETGDTLGHARPLAPAVEGDVLLIATTGAYGRVMSSSYNSRPPAVERFL